MTAAEMIAPLFRTLGDRRSNIIADKALMLSVSAPTEAESNWLATYPPAPFVNMVWENGTTHSGTMLNDPIYRLAVHLRTLGKSAGELRTILDTALVLATLPLNADELIAHVVKEKTVN